MFRKCIVFIMSSIVVLVLGCKENSNNRAQTSSDSEPEFNIGEFVQFKNEDAFICVIKKRISKLNIWTYNLVCRDDDSNELFYREAEEDLLMSSKS